MRLGSEAAFTRRRKYLNRVCCLQAPLSGCLDSLARRFLKYPSIVCRCQACDLCNTCPPGIQLQCVRSLLAMQTSRSIRGLFDVGFCDSVIISAASLSASSPSPPSLSPTPNLRRHRAQRVSSRSGACATVMTHQRLPLGLRQIGDTLPAEGGFHNHPTSRSTTTTPTTTYGPAPGESAGPTGSETSTTSGVLVTSGSTTFTTFTTFVPTEDPAGTGDSSDLPATQTVPLIITSSGSVITSYTVIPVEVSSSPTPIHTIFPNGTDTTAVCAGHGFDTISTGVASVAVLSSAIGLLLWVRVTRSSAGSQRDRSRYFPTACVRNPPSSLQAAVRCSRVVCSARVRFMFRRSNRCSLGPG